ncbi:MAG: type II secretion system protein GspE, partial [Candidatus Omnitrophota bacterium]
MDRLRKDFVALLVEKGLVTEDQLEEVKKLHKDRGGSLSQLLIELGYVSEKDLAMFISTYLSIPPVKLLNLKVSKDVLDILPKDVARKYLVIPLSKIGNTISLAMADPLNILILEDLERLTGYQINPVISFRSEIMEALNLYYPETVTTTIEEIIKKEEVKNLEVIKEEREEIKDEEIKRSLEDTPVVKLTNYILKRAVEMRASDIFIEPLRNSMRVRFRIDGLLHKIDEFPKKMHNLIISRIKVMANLDITEHRLPQEGRFIIKVLDRKVDFRISILPSTLGEKAALRVLDKSNLLLD